MPYLTEQGYTDRFGVEELEQVLATDETVTFAQALIDAQSIVDGYLAAVPNRVFAVPLAGAIPVRIAELTADLLRYEIHAKKVTHEIKRRRNEAIDFLKDMVKGLTAIPELLPDAGAVAPLGGTLETFSEPRVFTSCSLRDYVGR